MILTIIASLIVIAYSAMQIQALNKQEETERNQKRIKKLQKLYEQRHMILSLSKFNRI